MMGVVPRRWCPNPVIGSCSVLLSLRTAYLGHGVDCLATRGWQGGRHGQAAERAIRLAASELRGVLRHGAPGLLQPGDGHVGPFRSCSEQHSAWRCI